MYVCFLHLKTIHLYSFLAYLSKCSSLDNRPSELYKNLCIMSGLSDEENRCLSINTPSFSSQDLRILFRDFSTCHWSVLSNFEEFTSAVCCIDSNVKYLGISCLSICFDRHLNCLIGCSCLFIPFLD